MKKHFITLMLPLLGLFTTACSSDDPLEGIPPEPQVPEWPEEMPVFTAGIATVNHGPSRTNLSDKVLTWVKNDEISVFRKSNTADQYRATTLDATGKTATFTAVNPSKGQQTTAPAAFSHYVAVYPFSTGYSISKSSHYVINNLEVPATQEYAGATIANGTYPMVAVSEDNNLNFQNVCGIMRLNIKGKGTVRSIRLKGNSQEILAGKAQLETDYNAGTGFPKITLPSEGSETVTLDCSKPAALSASQTTQFNIVLPPVTFTNGFTVTVTGTNGATTTFKTTRKNDIVRSAVLNMPEITLDLSTASEKTVTNVAAGKLDKSLAEATITPEGELTVHGVLNGNDVAVLRELIGVSPEATVPSRAGRAAARKLTKLNLAKAVFVAGGSYHAGGIDQATKANIISANMFNGCKALTEIVLPENTSIIEALAFAGTSIKIVVIPGLVEHVMDYALANMPALRLMTVHATPEQITIHPLYLGDIPTGTQPDANSSKPGEITVDLTDKGWDDPDNKKEKEDIKQNYSDLSVVTPETPATPDPGIDPWNPGNGNGGDIETD